MDIISSNVMCEGCKVNPSTCSVSVVMPGKTDGIRNTQEVARLCNACVQLLIDGEYAVVVPKEALEMGELWQ